MKTPEYDGHAPVAVVPAAGAGRRFGGRKQFLRVAGHSLLEWSLRAVVRGGRCRLAAVAVDSDMTGGIDEEFVGCPVRTGTGGKSRAASVLAALGLLGDENKNTWLLVHDAVRPLVPAGDIEKLQAEVLQRAEDAGGGILAEAVIDAPKFGEGCFLKENLSREHLWLAQTPQMFRLGELEAALKSGMHSLEAADESQAMSEAGFRVLLVAGSAVNRKVTWASDIEWVKPLLKERADG